MIQFIFCSLLTPTKTMKIKIPYLHLLCATALLCGFVRRFNKLVVHHEHSYQIDNTTTVHPCLSPVNGVYDNTKDDYVVELYTHTKWQDLTTFYRQQPAMFYRCDEGNVDGNVSTSMFHKSQDPTPAETKWKQNQDNIIAFVRNHYLVAGGICIILFIIF